ncbi:MAG: family 43 glycosylhydrolase [Candidatus Parcubacteria bacterium]|nr:family 43 glycosylhydrolase [Burkholderiales bacterium]
MLASCAAVPLPPGPSYLNPVFERDFPDPAVLRDADGWFYAYATQSHEGERIFNIQVARSRDLALWEHLGDALPEKPRWAASKQMFWAPHVLHDPASRRYFMYYSAEPDAAVGKCLAVATAESPAGPFADAGEPLLCGRSFENIDPMAFDDPKTGKRLLYWGSASLPIRVRELAPDRMRFAPESTAVELLRADPARAYSRLVEGAWIVFRSGTYFLFYSGDRCCGANANYALMVARSSHALGPFELLGAPILEGSAAWLAPGHNSVATDDAGNDWILYHAMREAPQRLMLLDRIEYVDGWPRIAGGKPSTTPQRRPVVRGYTARP